MKKLVAFLVVCSAFACSGQQSRREPWKPGNFTGSQIDKAITYLGLNHVKRVALVVGDVGSPHIEEVVRLWLLQLRMRNKTVTGVYQQASAGGEILPILRKAGYGAEFIVLISSKRPVDPFWTGLPSYPPVLGHCLPDVRTGRCECLKDFEQLPDYVSGSGYLECPDKMD